MKLNCDLGESFGSWQMGNDADIMPLIDQANIACGMHAGDPLIMHNTVNLAAQYDTEIGAHPSYPDLQGFGRRSMVMSEEELTAYLHYQIGALNAIASTHKQRVTYVKPHGALYNDMMAKQSLFATVCRAIAALDDKLALVIQAIPDTTPFTQIAAQFGITLRFEAFADRNYLDSGLLVPRSHPSAVIHDTDTVVNRIKALINTGQMTSISGAPLSLKVDTLCVHSDTPSALALVKAIRQEIG